MDIENKIREKTLNENHVTLILYDSYLKNSMSLQGALYPDGTSHRLKMDDSVPPGGSYTYRWEVKPEFAPTDDDANCLTWVYHSHLDAPRDIASGLIGALLTCKKGMKIIFHLTDFTFEQVPSTAKSNAIYWYIPLIGCTPF